MMSGAEPSRVGRAVLEVRGLTVRFGDVRVVDDLGFTVTDGETLAIIGPSGAGKTVLFKALIGALPYEGTIRWAADAHVGYVLQKLDLERDLPIAGADLLRAKQRVVRPPRPAPAVSRCPRGGNARDAGARPPHFLGRPSLQVGDSPRVGGGTSVALQMRQLRAVEIGRPAVAVDVLVIEDDYLIREVLRELLASAGYGVTVAENGIEGLRRFADGRFHVVITDVRMPGPDGWEVARRLREASADVGIIVISASLDSEESTRGSKDGRHLAILAKPFTLEQLTATIDRLVTVRQAA